MEKAAGFAASKPSRSIFFFSTLLPFNTTTWSASHFGGDWL
jgi:hypothetical protein